VLRTSNLRKDDAVAKTYRLGTARRTVSVLMTAMLKRGIGAASTYLLTTTGCKTGQPRTTPVTLVEADGERWLVSPYGSVSWVHNVRARPQVSLRRGRTIQILQAEEVDAETAGPVLQRYIRQAPVTAPFFDAKANDPTQTFTTEAHRHPVFRLTELPSA
jgi:deazaflavin-dependent oxidoreductase (nitroreductase family)